MSRSKWKGPFIKTTKNKPVNKLILLNSLCISRKFDVTPKLIGKSFYVHTGLKVLKITFSNEMINYKIGEFVTTRSKFEFKKKKKKSKKLWVKK